MPLWCCQLQQCWLSLQKSTIEHHFLQSLCFEVGPLHLIHFIWATWHLHLCPFFQLKNSCTPDYRFTPGRITWLLSGRLAAVKETVSYSLFQLYTKLLSTRKLLFGPFLALFTFLKRSTSTTFIPVLVQIPLFELYSQVYYSWNRLISKLVSRLTTFVRRHFAFYHCLVFVLTWLVIRTSVSSYTVKSLSFLQGNMASL